MKMNVNELTGSKLDWAVSKCDNTVWDDPEVELYLFLKNHDNGFHYYSTNWAQGGPIIEREKIGVWPPDSEHPHWTAGKAGVMQAITGPALLIAAMRCYVASKLGDTVDIPEELV